MSAAPSSSTPQALVALCSRQTAAARRRSPTACFGATARLPCAPHVSFPWRVTDALMRMRARAQGDGGAAEVQGNTGRVAISGCAFDANAASRVRSSFRPGALVATNVLRPRPPCAANTCLCAARRGGGPVGEHGGCGWQLQLRGQHRRGAPPPPCLRLWSSPKPLRACSMAAPCSSTPTAPSRACCWRTAVAPATTTAAAAPSTTAATA